jgi:enamine deaminase RidA (YjgF/YER057c/UK114 family)
MTLETKKEKSNFSIEPKLSDAERKEIEAIRVMISSSEAVCRKRVKKTAIHAPEVLNEAYNYARPSSFSRGLRVELPGATFLFISGTASVDENGNTVHVGDFRAQTWRTFRNITALLASEGATWHDVVRTTCYLRDIERDYKDFNEVRTQFYKEFGLDPLPASTGIQGHLCREELLVEIEAIAIIL